MLNKIAKGILAVLPQHSLSRLIGQCSRSKMSRRWIGSYVNAFSVDTKQLEKPLEEYQSLSDFFTRKLHHQSRPVNRDPNAIVSPVDGTISQLGFIRDGRMIQAKGRDFSIEDLLEDQEAAKEFKNGAFITLYLSPKDYHRIHMPLDGELTRYVYVPGCLFPVNRIGVEQVEGLFSRNERLITYADTDAGEMAIVKVGAFIVGSVKVNYDPLVLTNTRRGELKTGNIQRDVYQKGEEMGFFEFGSTVILLFKKGTIAFVPDLKPGLQVKMGEKIATMLHSPAP